MNSCVLIFDDAQGELNEFFYNIQGKPLLFESDILSISRLLWMLNNFYFLDAVVIAWI